jgi:hypothetical protein
VFVLGDCESESVGVARKAEVDAALIVAVIQPE